MAKQKDVRRLAAILAADVVGYSRLMGEDEMETLTALKAHQAQFIDPTIAKHRGRIVKLMGDGMLVEFASVVAAVDCAVAIQLGMTKRNAEMPEGRRMEFRIGVNLGDVIVDGEDIHGDGVNVAARLEGLAEPGGVCVSGTVHEHVAGKLDLTFEDMGEKRVKNIARPVRVYQVRREVSKATTAVAPATRVELELPDKPSIAVLPFENMSGDPEQEYFADGIAEDIITALSRFHMFFVIARNSSFTYKGAAVDVKQVSRELGVQYVLEGSVRRASNRVRISAQLVDATTGNHVWAERYDRELADVLTVQDEITDSIAATVGPEFVLAEAQRAQRKDQRNLGAWDYVMRAHWHLFRFTKEDNAEARRLLDKAVELDPNSAMAFSDLAISHSIDSIFGWGESSPRSLSEAARAAQRAVALDDRDAWAYTVLGTVERSSQRHDDSVRSLKKAIDLNPNLAAAYGTLGSTLALAGESEAAVAQIQKAIRLSPHDPLMAAWFAYLATAAYVAERYDEAADWASNAVKERPNFVAGYRLLTASCGQSGRKEEAQAALNELLRSAPGLTLDYVRKLSLWKNPADMERYLDGLRKAGLPE